MPKQVPIPITQMNEPAFEVTLGNGAVIRIRTIVLAAFQIFGDDDKPFLQDGKAAFGFNIQNLSVVIKEPPEFKEMN